MSYQIDELKKDVIYLQQKLNKIIFDFEKIKEDVYMLYDCDIPPTQENIKVLLKNISDIIEKNQNIRTT